MAPENGSIGLAIVDSNGKRYSCSQNEFLNDSYDELIDRKTGFSDYLRDKDLLSWQLYKYTLKNSKNTVIFGSLVVVVASIAASIVGLNVAQVVYAASSTSGTCPCGSGNPHVVDPDNPEQRTNPQGNIIGNPHDIESGISNGNPHIPPI